MDYAATLRLLFDRAKSVDEFEYASTLVNLRGLEGPGWNPQRESTTLVSEMFSIQATPLHPHTRLRLLLFVYCHILEMDVTYHIVANMLRTMLGDRYSLVPFVHQKTGNRMRYFSDKLKVIENLSKQASMPEVYAMFPSFVEPAIRNAFFHSNYTLYENEFGIVRGKGMNVGGIIPPAIPIQTEVAPRIDGALQFFQAFSMVWRGAIESYKENRVVKGRFNPDGSYCDMELTTEEGYGLTGFRSPPRDVQAVESAQ